MMPPYGTPHPQYGAMYHPAGMYAHPAMYGQYGLQSDTMMNSDQTETKPELKNTDSGKNQAQKQSPLKRSQGSKGSLTMIIGGKGSEGEKGNVGVVMSQSSNGDENENESGSEGSTGGSEENKNDQHNRQKVNLGEVATDATRVGSYEAHPVQSVSGTPAAGGSLDMSLDYWNAGNATPAKTGKQMSASPSVNATPPSELWLQDEREVKRQRRKQSNRESARRSRLRKQAECEELGARADTLAVENQALRNELARVTEECKRLEAENASLVERVQTVTSVTPAPAEASVPLVQDVPANKDVETESPSQGNGSVKRTDDTPAGLKTEQEENLPS
jgi:plant G-box-binding factor